MWPFPLVTEPSCHSLSGVRQWSVHSFNKYTLSCSRCQVLFQAPEVIPALLLHLGRLEWLIWGVGDLELLREQTVMFVTQKQEGAVETGLAARTVTQRGAGLQGDLGPVLRRRPQVPGRAGRGGSGRVERPVPAAAARGQPGSVPEAGRTPGESGDPGAAHLSGPGLRAPGRAFGSVAGTAGARGAALERRVGPGSCCARGGDEPGGCGARAGPEPRSLPPCPPPAWPGVRGWSREARGSAWAGPRSAWCSASGP